MLCFYMLLAAAMILMLLRCIRAMLRRHCLPLFSCFRAALLLRHKATYAAFTLMPPPCRHFDAILSAAADISIILRHYFR